MRAAAVLVAMALLGTACNGVSRVDAGAPVEISGLVQHQDGSPASNARVALAKDLGPAEAFEGLFTVMSFGTACLVPEPPDICRQRSALAEVSGDGRYVLRVTGRDTQSFFGFASTLAVTGALNGQGAHAGPSTTLRFAAQSDRVALPPMRFWEMAPAVNTAGRAHEISWTALPQAFAPPSHLTLHVETRTGLPVWNQPAPGTSVRLDPRLLEDMAHGLVIQAEGRLSEVNLTTDVAYRSAQAPIQGPGAPPSRGMACTLHDERGATLMSPCRLTDGDVSTSLMPVAVPRDRSAGQIPDIPEPYDPANPPHPGDTRDESVVIDLGGGGTRSLVVVRGSVPGLTLQLSDDGQNWSTPITVQSERGMAAVPVGSTSARYVRMATTMGSVLQFTEVSVW